MDEIASGNAKLFAVHMMLLGIRFYWLKGTCGHMQCQVIELVFVSQFIEYLFGKMQSGGGCRNGAFKVGINGLIAVLIGA